MRLLALEHKLPLAGEVISMGRVIHKRWVKRVFGPLLGVLPKKQAIALLVVATDVYVWKLLRRDAGLSQAMTVESMRSLALIADGLDAPVRCWLLGSRLVVANSGPTRDKP